MAPMPIATSWLTRARGDKVVEHVEYFNALRVLEMLSAMRTEHCRPRQTCRSAFAVLRRTEEIWRGRAHQTEARAVALASVCQK